MTKDSDGKARYRAETLLSVLGRDPAANHGVVNPPVYHASTILHESTAALKDRGPRGPQPRRQARRQRARAAPALDRLGSSGYLSLR